MAATHPLTEFRLRNFTNADLPVLEALLNQVFPDEPMSLEQLEHYERTYPAGNPRLRLAAETADGQVVGYGECERPYMTAQPYFFGVFVAVDEAWRHRGIGQKLLAAVTPFVAEHGFHKLHAGCRENAPASIRFLDRAGFHQIGIRFESALDLATFDETPFLPKLARVQAAGYDVSTLAQARQQDPEADLRLYDVFAATVVDVPFPGGVRAEPNYETFRASTLDAPNTPAEGIFIARHEGRMVALTTLELLPNGLGITGTTGVLAAHRGRGVATLVKLASLRYLKTHGYTEARTHNDTANPPILALNEKIGYRRLPGWLVWEKEL
jgi:RimJ/RimL family protein N-acetyltransferase